MSKPHSIGYEDDDDDIDTILCTIQTNEKLDSIVEIHIDP